MSTVTYSNARSSPQPSKRAEVRVALEKLLKEGQAKNEKKVFRDRRRRPILIHESVLDYDKLLKSGRSLADVGRRIRHFDGALKEEIASYIVPVELMVLSREEPETVGGVELPLGTVISEGGLWLRYRPGIEEIGINDRGEVILREVEAPDPAAGPVRGSHNTSVMGRTKRLVTRLSLEEHEADRKEAEAWLRLFSGLDGRRTLQCQFKCAGIDYQHRGNVPYLHRTTQLNFFDLRDIDMVRIASLVAFRFRKIRRKVPTVTVISLMGLPRDAATWNALQKRIKTPKKGGGIPEKLQDSRFYDPQSKGIAPANFVHFAALRDLPDEITVITVNTDYHGEVKSRGVLSPLTAIMSLVDIISAHAGVAVLSSEGTATTFTGPTGTGMTTACAFWAEKNEKYRRLELRRRYEMDIRRTPDAGRLGEAGIQKELDRILSGVGILCQEDWVEILKEGAGQWIFWPTERTMYARTGGFPGLRFVLHENHPLLENVMADFGGSGDPGKLGRITHEFFPERIFYDPAWNHLHYDRSSRRIAANVFLERNGELDFCVKRVSSREAIDWLLTGRTPDGKFEPLYNAYPDFSGLLMQLGVVGEKLREAYQEAQQGHYAPLGAGDAPLGEAIFDKLDVQVKLWLDNCRETPTYIVNGVYGLELTQDINWLLSQHSDSFGDWKHVTVEQFKAAMKERYGVTYSSRGEWSHISPEERRS